jgi:DNA-binding transcriptional MocR family regulator
MNSGATTERVYETLKERVLAGGIRPGERLDPALLAVSLNSSVTPIRDALHMLAGEGLVTTRTGDGFHAPAVDAPALQDLYAWNLELLLICLRERRPRRDRADRHSGLSDSVIPVGATIPELFGAIAASSDNLEHRRELASINDRLRSARAAEAIAGLAIADEAQPVRSTLMAQDWNSLRRQLNDYHRRRIARAAAIVRAMYRDLPNVAL